MGTNQISFVMFFFGMAQLYGLNLRKKIPSSGSIPKKNVDLTKTSI